MGPGPRAVLVPGAPLLVPELTGPGAVEAEPVRRACTGQVSGLASAELVVVVGTGGQTQLHDEQAWGTVAGWGADVRAPAHRVNTDHAPRLSLALTLGCWLLDQTGYNGVVVLQEVAADLPGDACAHLGVALARQWPQASWLVVADGSTRRSERAPGAFDPRAEPFDAQIELAVRAGDPAALLRLDRATAEDLGASGRGPWQVLAGAWAASDQRPPAQVTYAGAPFGVGYLVARWG